MHGPDFLTEGTGVLMLLFHCCNHSASERAEDMSAENTE